MPRREQRQLAGVVDARNDGVVFERVEFLDADIMFDFDWMAPEKLPTAAPRLRWIQGTSAGIGEFLDRHQLLKSPIVFTTASGVHAKPLAEFALLGLLYFWRDIPRLRREQAAHQWERYANRDLAGRRALIIGLGGVGRELARTFAALGLEVWGTKRSPAAVTPEGVSKLIDRGQIFDALPEVDALILACPITSATRHMIGAKELAALPLGLAALSAMDVRELVRPHLLNLFRKLDETISYGVRDGTEVVVAERISTRRVIAVELTIGSRLPIHSTSMGRCLISFLPPNEREALIFELAKNQAVAPAKLRAAIRDARDVGYAISNQEFAPGLLSVAMPVWDNAHKIAATANVAVHSFAMSLAIP